MINFAWNNGTAYFVISLVSILLIYGVLFFAIFKVAKRRFSFVFLGIYIKLPPENTAPLSAVNLFYSGFTILLKYLSIKSL